jgi:spermidine dehydrogenase
VILFFKDDMTSASKQYRGLGMDRPIARRDLLNGVAIGITCGAAGWSRASARAAPAQSAGKSAADYPPARSGLRGNYPAAVDEFDRIRALQYARFPVPESEIQEEYDLAVVGGGLSGLAAAYFYRTTEPAGASAQGAESRRPARPTVDDL